MPRAGGSPISALKLLALHCLGFLRRRAVGAYGVCVLTRTSNGLLLVPTEDMMVGRRLAFNGSYDQEMLSILLDRCCADSEVLFVGAHVGAIAIPMAAQVRSVVAVEANPATFELLQMNVALNRLHNVKLHNFAAGDREGRVDFLASHLNSGASGIAVEGRGEALRYGKSERLSVEMKILDEVFPGARFDLIVMDVEGAEALVLRGMKRLIANSNHLLIEVFEHHLRQIAQISNADLLDLIGADFDEALILPEKPGPGEPVALGPYPRVAFAQMLEECCSRKMTNVLFSKTPQRSSEDTLVSGYAIRL